MPLAEAMELAGSFEALRPHLCDGSILARYDGLYASPEGEAESGPGDIPPGWWAKARIDPATGRVILATVRSSSLGWDGPSVARKVFAVEIELEREPSRRCSRSSRCRAPRRGAGGRDAEADWRSAWRRRARGIGRCTMGRRPAKNRQAASLARHVERCPEMV